MPLTRKNRAVRFELCLQSEIIFKYDFCIFMMQGLKPLVKNFYFASKLNLEPYELHSVCSLNT